MNWYKTIKKAKWKQDDDPYLPNHPYHGTGNDLHRPGEGGGLGSDETDSRHPPDGYSVHKERVRDRDIPQDTDGGVAADGTRQPNMQGDAFFRTPDDPNGIEQVTQRALNTDISRDKRKGVHNMNGTIYETISGKLKGV